MFVIWNGEKYLRVVDRSKAKYEQVDSLVCATRFELYKDANNVWKYLPKTLSGFTVKEVTDPPPGFKVEDSDYITELKSKVSSIEDFFASARQVYSDACDNLNKVNMEIEDIKHAIEFKKLDAFRAFKLESELKDALMRRRKYKDTKFILEAVLKYNLINYEHRDVTKLLKSMNERQYTPRIRDDLF